VCFRSELIVRDRRFSQVWLVLLATTAAIAVPEVHRAEASTESRLGTNGTQIRQSFFSPEPELTKPVPSASKPISKPIAMVADIPAAAPIKDEPLVTRSPAELAPIAAQPAIVAPPTVLAQSDQDSPNQIKITPEGPVTPPTTQPIQTPIQSAPEVAPAPSRAPELPTLTTPPGTPIPAPGTEARVLVGEVLVTGAGKQELEDEVYRVIKTRPGQTATRTQLQEDINAIFATGFFANVQAEPKDTPIGVRVTFEVQPNPILKGVRVEGSSLVQQNTVDEIFKPQYGTTLNYRDLQRGVQDLTKRYQDQGYVLAQVTDLPKVADDGVVTLQVAEGNIEQVRVRFFDKEGKEKLNKEGKPSGRTRDFIVLREMETKPGKVFNRKTAERDLGRLSTLGLFEDVKLSLDPGVDPRNAIVNVNVVERNAGSIAAGAGVSSASGLFGTISYQQQNLGGNNQKLGAEIQLGERELLFDANFSDPWIAGDPYRTSYTVNAFRRRSISLIYDGGQQQVQVSTGGTDSDVARILRTGFGVSFARPLSKNVFARSPWTSSLGVQYQSVRIQDSNGSLIDPAAPQFRRDPNTGLFNVATGATGADLSSSGTSRDDLLTVQLGFARDFRNDVLRPTSGSLLRFSTEQSAPIGSGSIFFNRLRGSYSQYIPTRLLKLSSGCRANAKVPDCPETFAFNIQAGTALGNLPPYEAFSLGGSNSIRGYDEGDVGAGKSFLQGTLEYRFPVFSVISGALFVDAGTDLGTGASIKGDPAGLRGKPGSGLGYGLGVRIQSPLGPIRIDYGFSDQGQGRFHFGIGERF
jgi:outer membrane protein insertion porin family